MCTKLYCRKTWFSVSNLWNTILRFDSQFGRTYTSSSSAASRRPLLDGTYTYSSSFYLTWIFSVKKQNEKRLTICFWFENVILVCQNYNLILNRFHSTDCFEIVYNNCQVTMTINIMVTASWSDDADERTMDFLDDYSSLAVFGLILISSQFQPLIE